MNEPKQYLFRITIISLTCMSLMACSEGFLHRRSQPAPNYYYTTPTATTHTRHNQNTRNARHVITDSWITTKVTTTLVADKLIHASDIHVKTYNGVVNLSGSVPTRAEKRHAQVAARQIKGVKKVNNYLVVQP